MRGIGVLEDGFVFTEAELDRGSPRFWWGMRKRAAYDRVLARRGTPRRESEDRDDADSTVSATSGVAGAAYLVSEASEKKTEGGSWFGSWGGGSDGGGSSDSGGGSDGGDGGSGE